MTPQEYDISDRHERLQTLFDISPDGIILHDARGDIHDVNKQTIENLGYSRDQLLSMRVSEIDVAFTQDELVALWGGIDHGDRETVTGRHRRADGSTFPVEVSIRKTELDGEDRFLTLGRDISQRLRHQAHLEEAQSVADMGSWYLDLETEELTWSEEIYELFGIDSDTPMSYDYFLEQIHPDDREFVNEEWKAALDGAQYDVEHRIITENEELKWVREKADIECDEAGEPVSGIGIVQDITDQKEREHQLSALHGATRRLIDADSHEEVAEIAVEAARELLDFSLPSMWYPSNGELRLVANSEEHQELLDDAGTPDPIHPPDSWLWDVIESGDTVVESPLPPEKLAAEVPLHSAIVLPIGEHGVLACAASGEVDFTEREVRIAEILARNVQVVIDQLDQRAALEEQRHNLLLC